METAETKVDRRPSSIYVYRVDVWQYWPGEIGFRPTGGQKKLLFVFSLL